MSHSKLQFKTAQLRAKNLQKTVESLLVIVTSLFVSAYLPSILLRYYYAEQQLFEQPALLEYIPLASFAIGLGYFFWVVLSNMRREAQAKRLEMELETMFDDCGCDHHNEDEELAELERIISEAEAAEAKEDKKPKKSPKRKTAKK